MKAQKIMVDNLNINSRAPYIPVKDQITVKQKVKGNKALTGYNVYYDIESDPFEFLELATDTTYTHFECRNHIGPAQLLRNCNL